MAIHCVIVTLKMQMIGIRESGPVLVRLWPRPLTLSSLINYSAPWQQTPQSIVSLLFGLQCCYHPPQVSSHAKVCKRRIELSQWIKFRKI